MPDWTQSMQQTYEFYEVNPLTWTDRRQITNITSCSITRDSTEETLGSASIDCDDDLTDMYVRVYLVTTQYGIRERIPLGTYLCSSPNVTFDGRKRTVTQDGYTPLLELKEKTMPMGYSIQKGTNIIWAAKQIAADGARAPIVADSDKIKLDATFVSDVQDTRLLFLTDLLANAGYHLDLAPDGSILFAPDQDLDSLQPYWTYTDDNSSILLPDISISKDLYGIPNVVEVIYSPNDTSPPLFTRATNQAKSSIVSVPSRGREIVYRDTNPDAAAGLTQAQIWEYARNKLKQMSSIEHTITYSHGYCDVRVGDCVELNYERAGLQNVKAQVIRQVINCVSGCTVQETAVYTERLWGD